MDYLKIFEDAGAILSGHFVLTNGIHSEKYVQCAKITQDPKLTELMCKELIAKLIAKLPNTSIDLVVSAAMGGIIPGFIVAKELGKKAVYCERVSGKLTLRRTFEIPAKTNVLIIEDVISMGTTSMEIYEYVTQCGANVVGDGAFIYRGDSPFSPPFPLVYLAKIDIPSYLPSEVPEYLQKIPIQKPGSRFLSS